jgi:hypothetical protein
VIIKPGVASLRPGTLCPSTWSLCSEHAAHFRRNPQGMETEASLILKDDGLPGAEGGEFFLTPSESSLHLRPGPEDRRSQPVSSCNPGDATSTGPVAFSPSRQNDAPGGPPGSARPSRPFGGRSPAEPFPGPAANALAMSASANQDGLVAVSAPAPACPVDLPHLCTVPVSCGSVPTKRLPSRHAGPPKPAAWRRSSALPTPPGLASPEQAVFPWLLLAEVLQ